MRIESPRGDGNTTKLSVDFDILVMRIESPRGDGNKFSFMVTNYCRQ